MPEQQPRSPPASERRLFPSLAEIAVLVGRCRNLSGAFAVRGGRLVPLRLWPRLHTPAPPREGA